DSNGSFPFRPLLPDNPVAVHVTGFSFGTCPISAAHIRSGFPITEVAVMRTFSYRLAVVAVATGLVLAGCHKGKEHHANVAAETATPQAAVQNAVKNLKAGDFDGLLKHMLPPADYKKLRST